MSLALTRAMTLTMIKVKVVAEDTVLLVAVHVAVVMLRL
jgi:hypothetical protein